MHTLRFKLTVSFLAMMLAVFLLFGIMANFILKRQFQDYVIENINNTQSQIVTQIENRYQTDGSTWTISSLEEIGMTALGDGLIVRVADGSGTVLWDAAQHNSGMCAALLRDMADNMRGIDAGFTGAYTEEAYTITGGTVYIGYYGPYFYSDNDVLFLSTLNKLLIIMTASSCLIAVFLGSFLAKRLSKPIVTVTKAAGDIADGHYEARIPGHSKTREIAELTNAINLLTERLGKQETLRHRLTADVAHELRTPMANLQGQLEAMIDGIWQPDEARLKSCLEETVRLTKIIGDLETLARYDDAPMSLSRERFEVSSLVTKTLTGFESELRSRGITLVTELTVQHLTADPGKIARVLINLVSNAMKYTPDGGQITVSLLGDGRQIHLSVKDNGVGISQDDLVHIFERFYRVDKSRSRDTGGTGIGLSIVKSIVTAHGGTIEAQSQPGSGSEFIVTLPSTEGHL